VMKNNKLVDFSANYSNIQNKLTNIKSERKKYA